MVQVVLSAQQVNDLYDPTTTTVAATTATSSLYIEHGVGVKVAPDSVCALRHPVSLLCACHN